MFRLALDAWSCLCHLGLPCGCATPVRGPITRQGPKSSDHTPDEAGSMALGETASHRTMSSADVDAPSQQTLHATSVRSGDLQSAQPPGLPPPGAASLCMDSNANVPLGAVEQILGDLSPLRCLDQDSPPVDQPLPDWSFAYSDATYHRTSAITASPIDPTNGPTFYPLSLDHGDGGSCQLCLGLRTLQTASNRLQSAPNAVGGSNL